MRKSETNEGRKKANRNVQTISISITIYFVYRDTAVRAIVRYNKRSHILSLRIVSSSLYYLIVSHQAFKSIRRLLLVFHASHRLILLHCIFMFNKIGMVSLISYVAQPNKMFNFIFDCSLSHFILFLLILTTDFFNFLPKSK